ncbi:MAG: Holliday junction branch migration DNA helicase RuvB [Actinobacteria bacterium]|nr:Holliday junction branch migration DNA helicase RuvB [Actinomycetota bacterium]
MSDEELIDPLAHDDDVLVETALRPTNLTEFVGQQRAQEQLSVALRSAISRGAAADHMLMSGPAGLGKTTLATITAKELGVPLRVTSGPTITHAGDLAAVLTSLNNGEVLFIDEIHRTAKPALEMLYLAMEDFRVDVMVGKGPGATAVPLEIAPFTLVGATTKSGLLPAPLRDRFGLTVHLDFYEVAELKQIILRSAALLHLTIDDLGASEIASRSRGTPRIANRLLRRVRDWSMVNSTGAIDLLSAKAALDLYEIDPAGLDRLDRAVLLALVNQFGGGPVGLSTLATAVGEEMTTISEVVEPYLVRQGLMGRTARGRVATELGYRVVGGTAPNRDIQLRFHGENG